MQRLLFTAQFKPGGLDVFKKFIQANLKHKVKEYNAFLKRYHLRSAKVWYQNVDGVDWGFLFHDAEEDALQKLEGIAHSKDPYDQWFLEQLKDCFDREWEEAKLLFEYDVH